MDIHLYVEQGQSDWWYTIPQDTGTRHPQEF